MTSVIVGYGRSAVTRGVKGSLAQTHPVDFGAEVLRGVVERLPGLDPAEIDDVIVGCALPEARLGLNPARNIVLRAGLPDVVSGLTVNRFCSSGLQAIATASALIDAGMGDVIVAGGVEHMSTPVLSDNPQYQDPYLLEQTEAYIPMGLTADNVARQWGITRAEMEAMAVESHARAAAAQEAGVFDRQIVPVTGQAPDGSPVTVTRDECVRAGTSAEKLAQLKPAFGEDGLVTAGTSSPRSDGAAFVVVMSQAKAEAIGATPLARVTGFAVAGVDPAYMGIGPVVAVPKLLARLGRTLGDIAVIELNEAFASQSIAVLRELGVSYQRVNVQGGALALGHPLGATGAVLTIKAIEQLRGKGGGQALITMCVGGGMGAAGMIQTV
ncbi:MAG: thiolase family protein [Propionibacteriaceae bacterium]|jgi:acetyl-CoA acyltransferase|nr:thiolase family protein [Propionibacteriaceae bacterium]